MSEYVRFVLADEQKPKTRVWNVLSKSAGDLLGVIKWYAGWRQCCEHCVWNVSNNGEPRPPHSCPEGKALEAA